MLAIYVILVIIPAKCEYPLLANNSVRIADNLDNPALKGATITFSCPPGKILIDYMHGEWKTGTKYGNCRGKVCR